MKAASIIGTLVLFGVTTAKNVAPLRIDFDIYDEIDNRDLVKRADSMEMTLVNKQSFYISELKIGSRNDTVQVLVDTGSSDLWIPSKDVQCEVSSYSKRDIQRVDLEVPADNIEAFAPKFEEDTESDIDDRHDKKDNEAATLSKQEKFGFFTTIFGGTATGRATPTATSTSVSTTNTCTSYGSFATESSNSFKENTTAPDFEISYADGTTSSGIWGYDNVFIGDTLVENLSFAVANISSSDVGVLGIGFPSLETTYVGSSSNSYMYQNLPAKLVADGVIKKNAYSIYLNSATATSGSVLFGAVDHAKYSGSLQTVPIVGPSSASYYPDKNRIIIVTSSIKIKGSSNEVNALTSNYRALLDTGSTLSYFPPDILDTITNALGATYANGYYVVNCPSSKSNINFEFNFLGATISIPYQNFVLQLDNSGKNCILGMLEQSNMGYMILGDNFLRSAYVVYDLDDSELSIAPVNYTDDEDIEVISSSVPSATAAALYSSTAIGSTVSSSATGHVNGSSSSNSGSSSNGSDSKSSSSSTIIVPFTIALFISLTSLFVSI